MTPMASVVIPAHNEEAVIGRCLETLQAGTEPGELEIVVVANGCTDRTVERARALAPAVTVLDLDEPSKFAALNAGDRVATAFPRAYLDADVEMTAASLRTVVEALRRGDVHCAAPKMELELSDRPWFVRSFFRALGELPYLADDLIGNGVYVLSQHGRSRFADFPGITADDLFIRNLFSPEERAAVPGSWFRVHPPRTLRGLLAIRERTYRGNAEYAAQGFETRAEVTRDRSRLISGARRRPFDMAVFVAVNVAAMARLRLRRRPVAWERDDSGRRT